MMCEYPSAIFWLIVPRKLVSRHWFVAFIVPLFVLLPACGNDDDAPGNCDDPAAQNYMPGSNTNEGCIYPVAFRLPTTIADLPNALREISGLASFDDHFIGHNDRSNPANLYFFDRLSAQINHTIQVSNAPNNDWEDLAMSPEHLYIADTGNNEGNRTDLGIFRISLADFALGQIAEVAANMHIRFRYPEQQRFDVEEHNFDCEALIYRDQYLYLFTKHRADRRTNLYRIPANNAGIHDAELMGGFNAGGRIGGADLSPDGNTVVLVGYRRNGNSFVWKLSDFVDPNNFLSGRKEQMVLGTFNSIGQVEGVHFQGNTSVYITSEEVPEFGLPPRLYFLDGI